jgi:hypothetical protein
MSEKAEVAAADACVEWALALRVQHPSPPGGACASGKARKVLLYRNGELDSVVAGPLSQGHRPARAHCQNASLDGKPARNELIGERELRQTETEKAHAS